MRDFINFRKMITPVIISTIFWLGVIACVIAGIYYINEQNEIGIGIGIIVLGPLALRVICENLIVLFTIQNTLTDIKNLLQSQQDKDNQDNSSNEG